MRFHEGLILRVIELEETKMVQIVIFIRRIKEKTSWQKVVPILDVCADS